MESCPSLPIFGYIYSTTCTAWQRQELALTQLSFTCSVWLCDTAPAKARRCDKAPLHLPQFFLQCCPLRYWTEASTQPALRHRGNSSKHHLNMFPIIISVFQVFKQEKKPFLTAVDCTQYSLDICYLWLWEWWTAETRACLQHLNISKRLNLLYPELTFIWCGHYALQKATCCPSHTLSVCDSVWRRVATSHWIYWNIKHVFKNLNQFWRAEHLFSCPHFNLNPWNGTIVL